MKMFLGAGRMRRHTSGSGGEARRMPAVKLCGVTYPIARSTLAANALRAMGEAEVSRCIWLKLTRTYSMLTGVTFGRPCRQLNCSR
eukprot:4098273-Pyramimonas_sp.AAC.1